MYDIYAVQWKICTMCIDVQLESSNHAKQQNCFTVSAVSSNWWRNYKWTFRQVCSNKALNSSIKVCRYLFLQPLEYISRYWFFCIYLFRPMLCAGCNMGQRLPQHTHGEQHMQHFIFESYEIMDMFFCHMNQSIMYELYLWFVYWWFPFLLFCSCVWEITGFAHLWCEWISHMTLLRTAWDGKWARN